MDNKKLLKNLSSVAYDVRTKCSTLNLKELNDEVHVLADVVFRLIELEIERNNNERV